MLLSEILPKSGIYSSADPEKIEISGISDHIDTIKPGTLFILKSGTHFAPQNHLDEIEKNGALALLLQHGTALPRKTAIPCFYAEDLALIEGGVWDAFYGYPTQRLHLYAVTGTNGKTTTALILAHLFQASGIPTGYIGTLGTFLGDRRLEGKEDGMTTPAPLQLYKHLWQLERLGARNVVLEVSSHAIAQKRTASLHFDAVLFTNLSEDHLDYHKTMEEYFQTKAALFAQTDLAILNRDDEYGERLSSMLSIPQTSVGVIDGESDYSITDLHENGCESTQYFCQAPEEGKHIRYPLFGAFNIYNSLLAIAAAHKSGLTLSEIADAMLTLKKPKGRLECLSLPAGYRVIVDYAHTPDAMEKAIKAVKRVIRGRLFVLFGAGGEREREKRPQMGNVATALADRVWITSDNTRGEMRSQILADILLGVGEKKNYTLIPDRTEAIRAALSLLSDTDTLLLLGKGHEEYLIEEDGKRYFSESEIVYDFIKEKEGK